MTKFYGIKDLNIFKGKKITISWYISLLWYKISHIVIQDFGHIAHPYREHVHVLINYWNINLKCQRDFNWIPELVDLRCYLNRLMVCTVSVAAVTHTHTHTQTQIMCFTFTIYSYWTNGSNNRHKHWNTDTQIKTDRDKDTTELLWSACERTTYRERDTERERERERYRERER